MKKSVFGIIILVVMSIYFNSWAFFPRHYYLPGQGTWMGSFDIYDDEALVGSLYKTPLGEFLEEGKYDLVANVPYNEDYLWQADLVLLKDGIKYEPQWLGYTLYLDEKKQYRLVLDFNQRDSLNHYSGLIYADSLDAINAPDTFVGEFELFLQNPPKVEIDGIWEGQFHGLTDGEPDRNKIFSSTLVFNKYTKELIVKDAVGLSNKDSVYKLKNWGYVEETEEIKLVFENCDAQQVKDSCVPIVVNGFMSANNEYSAIVGEVFVDYEFKGALKLFK
ncbi:MAG: hypothetical protein ABIA04_01170 [Pseudomonadota bacterium]